MVNVNNFTFFKRIFKKNSLFKEALIRSAHNWMYNFITRTAKIDMFSQAEIKIVL